MTKSTISNPRDFGKGLYSFLFNPDYIDRKLIYNVVDENSKYINGSVLDFGCGEKPYKNLFKYEKYIGVDFKSSGHDNTKNDIDIYRDGKRIPIENESFDSFICTEVLEHVFDIDTTLNEIHRVLKKGGKGIITIPFFIGEHEIPYDFARYTYFGIEDILKKHKFKIIKHERLGNSYLTFLHLYNGLYSQAIRNSKCYKYFGRAFGLLFRCPVQIIINLLSFLNFGKNKSIYLKNFLLVEKL